MTSRRNLGPALALTGAGIAVAAIIAGFILVGGPGLFPGPAQIHGECTCPDSPCCKHVVAAVYAFGVLLDREPEQLLSLWDLDTIEPARSASPAGPFASATAARIAVRRSTST